MFARFRQVMREEPEDLTPEELDEAQVFIVAATESYSTQRKGSAYRDSTT